MRASGVVALSCVLGGCNSILGIGAVSSGGADAPPGAPDAAVDAGLPSTVHGTAIDTYYTGPTTTTPVPEDLSTLTIAAYAPDGQGGFQVITGTGKADGTFTIPDVPAGGYLLAFGSTNFYYTTSRTPDLGMVGFGRVDSPQLTSPTTLTLHLDSMSTSGANDYLDVQSFATNQCVFGWELAPGQNKADPISIDWMAAASKADGTPAVAIDASKGDDLYVLHERYTSTPTSFSGTILDVYSSNQVTLTSGQSTSVTGSFTAVPQASAQFVFSDASAFATGLDVPPDQPFSYYIRRRAAFSTEAFACNAEAYLRGSVSKSDGNQAMYWTYGDPFPSTWAHIFVDGETLGWSYRTRGSNLPIVYTSQGTSERIVPMDNVTLSPASAPPHTIKVGGVAASAAAAVPFDGTHAVDVTWSPIVGIDHYVVEVLQLTSAGNQASTNLVGFFDTSEASISLPASLFNVGAEYIITVTATQRGGVDYRGGTLRRVGFPFRNREAVTARLLFAASCGNHAVDASYEECDEGGVATATCNADCTKPMCGDAIANTAAGEQCDTGGDSLLCDADCTPVSCGDGHVNTVAYEQCDLGAQNGKPGQCCSSKCALVPPATQCP